MRIAIVTILLVAIWQDGLQAQTVIGGSVLNAQGKPIEAYVSVTDKKTDSILAYSDVDNKGNYKLSFETDADSVVVTASGLTIGNHPKTVPNYSQQISFRPKEEILQLQEVMVKAKKIRQDGDTLSYNVASYSQQGDRVIADVLKRMPGIEVSGDGGIKFNGKGISKFYVEGMDLLQGRYGIATNNVNAQDVASVQVLQNHQPVKALRGKMLTDDVAMNLKLKSSSKGTLGVNAMVGGGIEGENKGIWTAELVGMYFNKKRQDITLYKGNNTGDDVSQELRMHYSDINSVFLYPYCPMGALLPNGSGLPQKRTFDNSSHVLTLNHLEKLGEDNEIGLNVAYYSDCVRRDGNSMSNLFVNDNQRLLTQESLYSKTKTDNLNIQLRYNRNASSNFIADVLKLDLGWISDKVDGTLGSERTGLYPVRYGEEVTHQYFDHPQLSVSNTLNIIRNIGKHTLDLHFSAGYSQRPNTLEVSIDSLEEEKTSYYVQDIVSRHIAGNFHTQYSLHLGDFTLDYGLLADASLHGIKTTLAGFGDGGDSNRNNLWYNTYEVALRQNYKFERAGWRVLLGCPLSLYSQTLDDRIRRDRNDYVHLLVNPMMSVGYEWMDWSGNLCAGYTKNIGSPDGIYQGYMMGNYRSFQRSYLERLSETERTDISVSLGYRNAISATFLRINGSYGYKRENQTYGTYYQGGTSIVQIVDRHSQSKTYSIGANGSKGFDWLQTTISLFANYRYMTSERLMGNDVYPFCSRFTSVGLGGSIVPFPWLDFVWNSGYSWSFSETKAEVNAYGKNVRSATQRVKMNTHIGKKLTMTASLEDNYNSLTAVNRHAWFGDVAVKLKCKRTDLELQLNNLLNQQSYTSVNYSGLDIYSYTSQLRSRNVIVTVRFKLL